MKQFKKVTGEAKIFKEIWAERPHRSFVSGKELNPNPDPRFFSHILTKGAYPSYRLVKPNIQLMTPEEHNIWEFRRWLVRDDPAWAHVFELYDALKEYYESTEGEIKPT